MAAFLLIGGPVLASGIIETVGSAVAIGAGLTVILSFIGVVLWRAHNFLVRIDARGEKLDARSEEIEQHTKQLTTNGGEHVADAVYRSEALAQRNAQALQTLQAAVAGQRDALVGHLTYSAGFWDAVQQALAEHGIHIHDENEGGK